MSWKTVIVAAILGAALGGGASYFALTAQLNKLAQKSPPVVIADIAAIAQRMPKGLSDAELDARMKKVSDAVVSLSDSGFLVLKESAVLAAPGNLYLPDDIAKVVGADSDK